MNYVRYIIRDIRPIYVALSGMIAMDPMFKDVKADPKDYSDATTERIFRMYSLGFRSRIKKGKLQLSGIRTYYRQVKRVLEYIIERKLLPDETFPAAVHQAMDDIGWVGQKVSSAFLWFGRIVQLPLFEKVSEDPKITEFIPGGLEKDVATKPATRKAP